MPFDIRQLRYAIAAADHRSFHRASLALEVEQSTLSRAVLRLERSLGGKLFTRSRAGITITTAGAEFIRDARHIVAKADRLVATMRAAGQGRAGGLTIGYNTPISAGHLRATLFDWHSTNPRVEMDCIEADRQSLIAGLDAAAIDISVMAGDATYTGIRRASLWNERLLVALPANHPLAEREHVEWTDLRAETFQLSTDDAGLEARDMLLGRLSASGLRPAIKLHDASRDSILSVLGGGFGVTIIPESGSGAQYPDVIYRDLHGAHGRTLIGYSGYWRADNENPALRRFLAFVRSRYSLVFDI